MGGCNINTSFTDYARENNLYLYRCEEADVITCEGCSAEQPHSEVISPASD